MNVHRFPDEELRQLAILAINLEVSHLPYKVVRVVNPDDNYWSFDVRFSHDEKKLDVYYDAFHLDCGRDNQPETYQMSVIEKRGRVVKIKPITSPLVVVHYFEQMCKRARVLGN